MWGFAHAVSRFSILKERIVPCREFTSSSSLLCPFFVYGACDLGDRLQIKNGMAVPFFMLQDEKGPVVPIFSSEERAQECLARNKVPPNTLMIVSMEAGHALEALGKCGLRTVVDRAMPPRPSSL